MSDTPETASLTDVPARRRTLLAALGLGVGVGVVGLPSPAMAAAAGWSNPTRGTLTSGYKTPSRPTHTGWDVAASQGTPVYATAAGTVRDIKTNSYPGDTSSGPLPGRSGNSVHLNHADSYFSYYGHLHRVLVSAGQQISCGQLIGLMGNTGNSTGPHLHFEIHRPRLTSVDPRVFLANRGITLGSTAPVGSTGYPSVSQGASGWVPRVIQYLVRARGISVVVDGGYGAGTVSAVRSFQSGRGLYADGLVGPITWTALVLPLREGNSGDLVRGLQTALNARGASLLVDGGFGSVTTNAVRSFQSRNSLVADGLVGPVTWSVLI
ncbi:peptidoglycan DD-metalloendopeptidase family protein [Micromonospora peucetia]|uniref:Murein DD-endopeptidase MepM and murein hydrolase activator NlpD, contain LysM domain n=1 Tax=Micromonospora peucetia TaxID=47871 RepID=A0A1C6U872_9ACTN|nr:peptidoglycan DD-metalloendopeptidase family protein [Micromonospora peucetia]WSA33600.1 peptidoglycan DD-metalloendopeptidase family protein [Micromonospora peucetia]SCL50212.1 Murein DD-endopeptidase MepM and murein hydrolase activator NlpD, contain LysM domain [Micromonospora peucetia]